MPELDSIHIDKADNGFEVCIRYKAPKSKSKKGESAPYNPGEEKKEVYESVGGVLECVEEHLEKGQKEGRKSKAEELYEGKEEDDEDED